MRAVLTFGMTVLAVWLAVVLLAYVFQRQLIYLPDTSTPSAPVDVEAVQYTTEDSLRLTGWFLTPPDPVSVVLVAPGNAGHRAFRMPLARGLVERGHAVLLVDYRGYGGNPGRPSETGIVADVRAARDWLAEDPRIDPERIVYLGESVGSSAAAALAAEAPPLALVLRSPFSELAEVGRSAYPFLPIRTLLRDRHPTLEHLEQVEVPALVVAGDSDRIVPTRLSRAVAEASGAELVEIAGAGHNDAALFIGDRFLDAVDAHVRRAVGDGTR